MLVKKKKKKDFGIAKLLIFCLAGRLMTAAHCHRRAKNLQDLFHATFEEYASVLMWLVVRIQMCKNGLCLYFVSYFFSCFCIWMHCYRAINVCKIDMSPCLEGRESSKMLAPMDLLTVEVRKVYIALFKQRFWQYNKDIGSLLFSEMQTDEWEQVCQKLPSALKFDRGQKV